ncbi:zinc-binding dehydrogenase [Streptomyces carpinensis]|uniref:Zinc-binding dehydrogenase n=1 Tax=Streptomyces carpinensis TaxID=66369 RepID=A0ABV1VVZ6_9ACTN|nr:zinc-binding dehydrogenase [Streptomyces carpinensis]
MSVSATVAVHTAGQDGITMQEVILPSPTGHQVLVTIEASGLCRSQLRQMTLHGSGAPYLLGHEGVGVVAEVGPDVRDLNVGDRVVVTWIPVTGEGVRTPQWATVDLGDGVVAETIDGIFTWGTHTLVDESFLVPLTAADTDPALSLVGCALITGLGSAVYVGECSLGENVVVIGAGGVGLAAIAGAACAGAAQVLAVDIDDAALALARELGATSTLNSRTSDLVEHVRATMGRGGMRGADLVIDCVGETLTANQALECARPAIQGSGIGGRVVVAGVREVPITFEGAQFVIDQKRITGALAGGMGRREILTTLDAIRSGRVNVGGMVTETARLADLGKAVERLRRGEIHGRALVVS